MRGRYAGVQMRARTAILPGVARLARLPAETSSEAKRRWLVVNWYEQHSCNARLTGRHFGFSPDTVCRWVRRYRQFGVGGLETGSRRPRNVRQPETPPHVLQRILELREENPSCGREKLHRLLLAEGIRISPKSIDRVIARLKARGVLREPALRRKAPKPHFKRLRRPHDLSVEEPGALIQMDSKYVQLPNGRIERSFRTDDDEFYHVYDLPADFGGIKDALLTWNHRYESWRLHQALGYLTPDQFYQQWLAQHQRKEAVSDMS